MNAPASDRAEVREVGLRDGLQMVGHFVPTETKLAWLQAEAATGVRAFDVTSFVSKSRMPQFADAEQVLASAQQLPCIAASVLALNARGAERALEAGARRIAFVLSASGAHSRGNAGRDTDAALTEFSAVVQLAHSLPAGQRPTIEAGIATAFGCTLEGAIEPNHVRALAGRLSDTGADSLMLADTVGYAQPRQVASLFRQVRADLPGMALGAHLHDTRGLALANVVAALDEGVRYFDAALGGLGGCPFAPGASGNVATEDLVYLLHAMGIDTGIRLPELLALRARLGTWLPGAELRGAIAAAGLPKHFADTPAEALTD